MTKLFIFAIIISLSFQAAGQEEICLADTTSVGGQILQQIKKGGFGSLTLTVKRTGKKYSSYRLCDHYHVQVDSLNKLLSNEQVDTLLSCSNGALKAVGYILYSKRHNNKADVTTKLEGLLNQEYMVMTTSCSDAITLSSLGNFIYSLITQPNFFFKPNFELTTRDKELIQQKLLNYESQSK